MSEQSTQNQQDSNQESAKSQAASSADQLLSELDRLGNQLIDAIRTAWQSDQRKELEVEISKGITTVTNSLSEGLQKVSESESARTLINKAEEVFSTVGEQVRTSKVSHEVVENLRNGIQSLNDQLAKFTSDLKKDQPKASDDAQDIKVEKG